MTKINHYSVLLLFFSLLSSSAMGQFTNKMEMDFHFGFQNSASKQLTVADGYTYEIGKTIMPLFGLDVWYNITRNISAGLNIASTMYIPMRNEEEDDDDDSSLPIEQSYHSSFGLGAKYHVVNKKKFKVYGKTNMNYSIHRVQLKDYYFVKTDPAFEDEMKFSDTNAPDTLYTGIGAAINVGMKTYFGNSGGMVFEGGYMNNGYYKGPTFTLGFFFDFIKD